MKDLAPGELAPSFAAMCVGGAYGTKGVMVDSAELRGKTVVLYFYPKDDTPGCTSQACALRDRWAHFSESGAEVFGVSVDSLESHRKFIAKHDLPFALLSDPELKIVNDYGVWVEKSMYGRKFMGTERTTFVIRPDGRIKSVRRRVSPAQHADILMEDLADFKP